MISIIFGRFLAKESSFNMLDTDWRATVGSQLQKFGEVLEALCAGCHPKLHALCFFLFLGGQHQWSQRNLSPNSTKSHETAQKPLGK